MTKREIAEQMVEALFRDMDDRSGFDTGDLPSDVLTEWKKKWVEIAEKALAEATK